MTALPSTTVNMNAASSANGVFAGISVSGSELYLRDHVDELAHEVVAAARVISTGLGGGTC